MPFGPSKRAKVLKGGTDDDAASPSATPSPGPFRPSPVTPSYTIIRPFCAALEPYMPSICLRLLACNSPSLESTIYYRLDHKKKKLLAALDPPKQVTACGAQYMHSPTPQVLKIGLECPQYRYISIGLSVIEFGDDSWQA